MRWGWICALALVAAPVAVAQQNAAEGAGPFRLGMTLEEARIIDPTLRSGSMGLFRGERTHTIGGFSFRPALSLSNSAVSMILYSTAGRVRDAAQCREALYNLVAALERQALLSGVAGPSEYGEPSAQRATPRGSQLRFYTFAEDGAELGYANTRAGGWFEATSEYALRESINAYVCELEIELRPRALPENVAQAPPPAAALANARLIERPQWATRYTSNDLEMVLPRFSPDEPIQVEVALDCLV